MVAAPRRDRGQRQGTSMAPPWSPFTRCAVVCRVLMPEKTSRCVRGVFSRVRATVRVLRSASSSLSRALHVGMSLVGYATPSPMLILWPDSSNFLRDLSFCALHSSRSLTHTHTRPHRHTHHSLRVSYTILHALPQSQVTPPHARLAGRDAQPGNRLPPPPIAPPNTGARPGRRPYETRPWAQLIILSVKIIDFGSASFGSVRRDRGR